MARAAVLLTLAGCAPTTPALGIPADDSAARMQRLFDEYAAAYSRAFPDVVEYLGRPLEHHDSLTDNSLAAVDAWREREDAWLRTLSGWSFPPGSREWVLHGYLVNTLESAVATRPCRTELWPAHQFGWQTTLLVVLEQQPLETVELRAEAWTRWSQLPRFLQTEMVNLREGLRLGYTAPRRNVELAIAQLDALLALPSAESPLSSPARRTADPSFRERWTRLVTDALLPAVQRYRDFLRDEYAPGARTTLAITGIPNGAACYLGQIRTFTGYRLTPAELYERGERAVAEREAKALEVARAALGKDVGELRSAQVSLAADPRNRFGSAPEVLAFVQDALARAERSAPAWFDQAPSGRLALVPYEAFEAKARPPARYEPASSDGARPARFRIDVDHLEELERLDLEVTAFHEGIPGHHLQLGRELPSQPRAVDIRGLGAFFEGWARYAEGLADEMGLYSSDLDRFGAAAHLPTGLVVDPGIHARGWTREHAVAWVMTKQVAFSVEEAEAYVDRIAVCPGELLSYGFGERELLDLRNEAQLAWGDRFDIKSFHQRVLAHGALPLPLLRAVVTRWLQEAGR